MKRYDHSFHKIKFARIEKVNDKTPDKGHFSRQGWYACIKM